MYRPKKPFLLHGFCHLRSQGLARSLAGCIYREKSVESSSVTADPSAIGQIGHRPAHLQGTRANDSKGALAIAHGRLARYTQILHNADHVFLSSALPLSSTLWPWPSSVPVTSSICRPEERLMFAASFTVAPASMAVGNSSAEATVTASLAFATRPSPDCWHSAPFSAFCASAASHSFRRSAAASAPSSDEGPSACGSFAEMPKIPSAGPADRSLLVGRAFSAGCAPSAATASLVLSISLGVCCVCDWDSAAVIELKTD